VTLEVAETLGVRKAGLEPARPKAPEPKSGVYANFTTSAWQGVYGISVQVKIADEFGDVTGGLHVIHGVFDPTGW
jgi:hypothetical protein